MTTVVLENRERKLTQEEFLKTYQIELERNHNLNNIEIKELTTIVAKNPVDKFMISEEPKGFIAQGDLLIWSELTPEFKENYPRVTNLKETSRMALQDDDSITGDHELVTLKNSKFTLKTGKFVPKILEDYLQGSNSYDCKILEIDSPFIIKHREHGNFTFLTGGKYMICSSLDSETLTRMQD